MSVCLPQASREVELPHTFEEVRAERAKRSLREYVREAWRVVEPATNYVHGWHIDAMCEHLEAISSGQIRNLVINVPPRHQKSLTVSVFWPTWEWIDNPHLRYIYSAYGQDLSVRDALKSRRLILSPWYQEHYGDSFELTSDQNQKTRYDNNKTGYRIATGVGGMATGEGGDRLVLDDPHKLADTHSDAAREEAIRFWNETMSTRGNDPETAAKVVIMQRVHERDVTGDIIERMESGGEQYEMLVLPAEYEPSAQMYVSSLNWKDPRGREGELLWPERFSDAAIANLKVNLGDSASGQLQQRPSPAGGLIFDRGWWNPAERPRVRFDITSGAVKNRVHERYLFFDTAHKDKETSSYAACVALEVMAGTSLVNTRYAHREHVQTPDLPGYVEGLARQWDDDGLLANIVIEERASGIGLVQTLERAEPWLADKIVGFAPPGSKDEKCRQAAVYCQLGLVPLPYPSEYAEWLTWFFEGELLKVPNAKFRDASDAFALGILYLENYLAEARLNLLPKDAYGKVA